MITKGPELSFQDLQFTGLYDHMTLSQQDQHDPQISIYPFIPSGPRLNGPQPSMTLMFMTLYHRLPVP